MSPPSRMSITVLLLYFLCQIMALELMDPIENQLPQVVRVGQPYSWSFSPKSFQSADNTISYSTSELPRWLFFDHSTLTFSGIASPSDEGYPGITVIAQDSRTTLTSDFTLCVTSLPPPTLLLSIADQFIPSNPSLSSVFIIGPSSAIRTSNPGLWTHPRWSFSIGFDGEMYTSDGDLVYDLRRADGLAIPDWMEFNRDDITLEGVVPHEDDMDFPSTIPLALIASDQEGYRASTQMFDMVLTKHELSTSMDKLPTINITALTPFNISLSSPADFSGVLVDGEAIQPQDIETLSVDTSAYGKWLKYDDASRTLSGDFEDDSAVADQKPTLPVRLATTFHQSIETTISLELMPLYFSSSKLPPYTLGKDRRIQLNLAQYFSNVTGVQRVDITLTAVFDPIQGSERLKFDPESAQLVGSIPEEVDVDHITVTFIAYSHVTHTTSHASLSIILSPSDHKDNTGTYTNGLSAAAHKRLALGLGITFGLLGGFSALGTFLAICRRCARVEDTALTGEEGRNAWSDQEKKWYGIGLDKFYAGGQDRGYGWTDGSPGRSDKPRNALDLQNPLGLVSYPAPARVGQDYGNLGLGLRRVSERSQSSPVPGQEGMQMHRGFISKGDFIARIQQTVRRVSDKCNPNRRASNKRPVIGKPILLPPNRVYSQALMPSSPTDAFYGPGLQSNPGSTIMTNSPSASTGERSIPRRRADFVPPKSPALVHFQDESQLTRQLSTGSTDSLVSNASVKTHAAEAVVHTASRATSVHSGRSASGISAHSFTLEVPQVPGARPRLMPFTSATRVPAPLLSPNSSTLPALESGHSTVTTQRVASQSAKVRKSARVADGNGAPKRASGDELAMGLHYVRSLGADPTAGSNISDFTNVRSSFSSIESSHQGHTGHTKGNAGDAMRMLVRTGEKFKFRVPVPSIAQASHKTSCKLEARLISGKPLPKFLHVELNGIKNKGSIIFSGTPSPRDLGELDVGVYKNDDGVRVARVIVQVVGKG